MSSIYLPIIGGPVAPTDPIATCFGNDKAIGFYTLLVNDPRQRHPHLICCPALVLAAQRRAHGLANGEPWGHVDSAGVGTNAYALAAGCLLPAHYGRGNSIESITAGTGDVQAAFDSLARSPSHARHLFGENDFFRAQTTCGIGYAENPQAPYKFYWSVIISECIQLSGE